MFAIVDIEASGSKYPDGRIIDIAIILHDGKRTVYEYNTLVNPGKPILPFYTQLTGIKNEMLQDAPYFHEVAQQIADLLEGCTFVAHGVNFDYKFLQQELKPSGIQLHNRRLCTFKLSQKYLPGMPKYGLETLSKELGFEKVKHHRALADARMTAQLLEIILDKWQDNDDF